MALPLAGPAGGLVLACYRWAWLCTLPACFPLWLEARPCGIAWPEYPAWGSISPYLDGLSLLFALLITGIGVFIVIYSGGYLKGHPDLSRFYLVVLLFMASMLGLVLADSILTLFVMWELTSLTSYLLIGFRHLEFAVAPCGRILKSSRSLASCPHSSR